MQGIRAANPGPFTLSGTNSWLVGRDPAWLIDPGPALPDHIEALGRAIADRGGLGAVLLTHDHADHSEAVDELRARHPGVRLGAARGEADVTLGDGVRVGPLTALPLPGHAADHVVFLLDAGGARIAFSGDAVLGVGSVFVAPGPGALAGYLRGLERLRALAPALICPGHGPIVEDPDMRLSGYIEHRLDRERRLLAALDAGVRRVDELLDRVWDEAPPELRPAATLTLAAHLGKLEEEGRLPPGVERPVLPALG